jgi:hypothetical protein
MSLVRYSFLILSLLLISPLSFAEIWKLETTLVPQEKYPVSVDPIDFSAILTTYNTYMDAFANSDFHIMADQMDFKSQALSWNNRLDAIDNFSFIKDHILQDYAYSDVKDISFIVPKIGGYVLSVRRIERNLDGIRIGSAWSFYEFQKTDEEWKISSVFNSPSLKSPF